LTAGMETAPQILKNVMVPVGSDPLSSPKVAAVIARVEAAVAGTGRILIRKSGTEPKIRVMMEGDSLSRIQELVDEVCQSIQDSVSGDVHV
ncbi:MAG TPA: phosphoglucosamine mutase, partial [Magnetococcales bacterium]|nr:phosphoglucosamine mutase [Magnetococcales bacterium]